MRKQEKKEGRDNTGEGSPNTTNIARMDYPIEQFNRDLLPSTSLHGSAGVQKDWVSAHKQVLEQIVVGDRKGDLVDVLEDCHNTAQPDTGSCSPGQCGSELCRDAGRPQGGAGQVTMPCTPYVLNATRTILNLKGDRQHFC